MGERLTTPCVSRRRFVGLAGCAAVVATGVCFGGGVRALAGEGDFLRPPGGQDEQAFLARCLRCDRCRSVCPTNVISLVEAGSGFLSARTPTMDFHQGFCDFCGKCLEVCTTGALASFDPARDKIGIAVVQQDRCLAFQQGCSVCADSCAYGALSFDEGMCPRIDAQLCNGCGACEDSCTALVYSSFSGGTRRGIVTMTRASYEALVGNTLEGGE